MDQPLKANPSSSSDWERVVFGAKMSSMSKPKSEMTQQELHDFEQEELDNGPMALLTSAVKSRAQVLISCRNGRKLLATVKAFDRHFNMVLEAVREVWTETARKGKGKKKKNPSANKDRYISKMFLRGDSVVLVVFASK